MPQPNDEEDTTSASTQLAPARDGTIERPRAKSNTSGHHKKSASANFISRLPFFNRITSDASPSFPTNDDTTIPFPDVQDIDDDHFSLPSRSSALAAAFDAAQDKTRQRKGSLRKAALLGTGKLRLDRRFSSSADISKPPRSPTKLFGSVAMASGRSSRKTSLSKGEMLDGADSRIAAAPFPLTTNNLTFDKNKNPTTVLLSPLTSPLTKTPYASITSNDDFNIPPTLSSLGILEEISPSKPSPSPSPSPPSSESSLKTSPSHRLASKPLSTSPLSISPSPDSISEWDYSATEWWGWIILLVTWVVFVVGMGSCLEVWSWAWDVGETPYAPPELEDDPTLPIVGYYPALIILTAVMSWVWVVVAWVGMKYFKHARTHEFDRG